MCVSFKFAKTAVVIFGFFCLLIKKLEALVCAFILDSFSRQSHTKWDVICAHGILLYGVYRDTYAFRTDTINTNHHWAGTDHAMYNITIDQKVLYRHRIKVGILIIFYYYYLLLLF